MSGWRRKRRPNQHDSFYRFHFRFYFRQVSHSKEISDRHIYKHRHRHTQTLTHTHTRTLTHPLTLTLTHTHTNTHTLSLSLSHTHTHTLTHSLRLLLESAKHTSKSCVRGECSLLNYAPPPPAQIDLSHDSKHFTTKIQQLGSLMEDTLTFCMVIYCNECN